MTTITNYLHSNFVGKQTNLHQRPFLVIQSTSDKYSDKVWEYTLRKNLQNKSLIVLDFGIRTIKNRSKQQEVLDNKLKITTISKELKQYNISIQAEGRKSSSAYQGITQTIQDIIKNNNLSSSLLLIQGLLSLQMFVSEKDIRKLLSQLNNINQSISQINIIVPTALSLKTKQQIQRIGSCILKLSAGKQNLLDCEMIVRRYTGYSSREWYVLDIGQILKAKKKQKVVTVSQPTEGLVKSLAAKQQQKQLRKIIFPYLNVQDKCDNNCKCEGQQFIVLDEQQEDQDDVDV